MTELTVEQALNIGLSHHKSGRLQQAEALYRQVLSAEPNNADALYLLGMIGNQIGRFGDAANLLSRAVKIDSSAPEFHKEMAKALLGLGQIEGAVAALNRAIELRPSFGEAHFNLGNIYKQLGDLDKAIACYRKVIELEPNLAEAHANVANALQAQGKLDDAIASYRKAIALNSRLPSSHNNLGVALQMLNRYDDAVVSYRTALTLAPDFPEAHNNLANALARQGLLDEAIASYRAGLSLAPRYMRAHSNLLFTLHYHPNYTPQQILDEHRNWAEQHAKVAPEALPRHNNDRTPDRRLRVGYISPDFRDHPIARFLLPLLSSHDRERFEIYCFSDSYIVDDVTRRVQSHTDHWINVAHMDDLQVASRVLELEIDILVDLTLHASGNRMPAFALKPAPVQVTYLGYAATTGLPTMDYRLTDPRLDPPGNEQFYTEQSIRLPETYWCYQPPSNAPDVTTPPALQAGHITFGCLNNFAKVNRRVLETWAKLLHELSTARLIMHCDPGSQLERTRVEFAALGVNRDRVEFVPRVSFADYLALHNRIDIALDTFPYAGGTTTCDALWMGVPVVPLAGEIAVRRAGQSLLTNVGLPDLVAHDADQYVNIASSLARDLPRLQSLRTNLRQRMASSPLTDAPRFARHVEDALRNIWRKWCERA